MPRKQPLPGSGVRFLPDVGQQPINHSRKTKENKYQRNHIHNKLARKSKQFATMQPPKGAEERKAGRTAIGRGQFYALKTAVRCAGKKHLRPSCYHERVSACGNIRYSVAVQQV